MMLYKLAIKNIRKSFKDYAIYFFTLVLGVAIFYVFNAIESQTVLLNVTSYTLSIIDLMVDLLSGVSVFVSFILGFLIIYASRFLMKRRNKEFGIYLTLGMSKGKISKILLWETIIIGLISLVVGLVLGVLASQFMSVLVANSFEADLTQFTFVFSGKAVLKTIIYFGIMYLLVMIFNTINVGRTKLIDLLHASKKSEEVKMKNPLLCTIVFLISVALLGYAYYLVTVKVNSLTYMGDVFKPIIMGCISTFLIFWSLSGLILRIVMSFKRVYYKGLNSFVLRQISSKINTMVLSMSVICLMLFVTICVFSSSLSIKNSMTANLNELAPADIQIYSQVLQERHLDYGYNEEQIKNSYLLVKDVLLALDFDVDEYLEEYIQYNIYESDDLTFGDTLGDSADYVAQNYTSIVNFKTKEIIMSISDYNKLAKMFGEEEYTLADDEYLIIADFDSMMEIRNVALANNTNITISGYTLKPKYNECQYGFTEMASNHINTGVIIVPDHVVSDSDLVYRALVGNYVTDDLDEQKEIQDLLANLMLQDIADNYTTLILNTRLDISESSVGLGAMVTFIGLYLGIIFLISSAAILALKELSESADNKERYKMLRKIGVDEAMINQALFKQIAIFFSVPLILAIIHSIFGIEFCKYILMTFGNEEMTKSITMTAVFLVIIYGGYFLITYYCSKNIIKEK